MKNERLIRRLELTIHHLEMHANKEEDYMRVHYPEIEEPISFFRDDIDRIKSAIEILAKS